MAVARRSLRRVVPGMALLAAATSCTNQAGRSDLPVERDQTYATTVNGVKLFVADQGAEQSSS
jgi:hypothetical protein